MDSLVAYGSSDESSESDNEELSKPVEKTQASLVVVSATKAKDSDSMNSPKQNDNLPISDDEDEFIPQVSSISKASGAGGLQLPAPKHQISSLSSSVGDVGPAGKSGASTILSSLPKPKHESTSNTFIDAEEDDLEDFVKRKPEEKTIAEKPPPVKETKKRKTIQITVPELPMDSDEEDENSMKKSRKEVSTKPKGKCGLFAVLPAPKHLTASKEMGKMFMPSSISKSVISSDDSDFKTVKPMSAPKPSSVQANSQNDTGTKKFKSNMFVPASLTRKTKQSSLSAFNLETGMMMPKTKKKSTVGNNLISESSDVDTKDLNTQDKSNMDKVVPLVGIPMDSDSDEDDEDGPSSFFSLGGSSDDKKNELSSSSLTAIASISTLPGVTTEKEKTVPSESKLQPEQNEPLTFSEAAGPELQDAPLQFKQTVQPYQQAYGHYGMAGASGSGYHNVSSQGYGSSQQYNLAGVEEEGDNQGVNSANAGEEMEEGTGDYMHDQEFWKMQGKSKRGKEEINIIDVRQDDQITDYDMTVTKNISEEQNSMSYSKKKNKDMPSSQQKRKHQITYLAFRAKERELELKNQWADNRSNKRQSQAKYGF